VVRSHNRYVTCVPSVDSARAVAVAVAMSGSPSTVSSVNSGRVVAIERARHGVETRASTTFSARRTISHTRCQSSAGADVSPVSVAHLHPAQP